MTQLKHPSLIFFLLFVVAIKISGQDNPAKIVNDAYFECFGRPATTAELNTWSGYVKTHNASINDLVAEQIKYIKDSPNVQKNIIRKASEDVYGNSFQAETDSCFKSKTNESGKVFTYLSLVNELKDCLSKNIHNTQLQIIQHSYNDYFGIQVNAGDKNVKSLMDSSATNSGTLYKILMEQHRLYVIKNPQEQKAIISRAFNLVFGRDAKVAEMDSWFDACKNGGCSYTALINQYNDYKKKNPKPVPPVLAPAGFETVVYTRTGSGINEGCNCIGEKMYLVNADEMNSYKALIAVYSFKSNITTTIEYTIAPHEEKSIGCTKDLECLYSILYSVVQYIKM
jgi:hypothetical protein